MYKNNNLTKHKVIIIGAAPAGLATAACLKERGINALILEQSEQVAHRWNHHYERLKLHTHKDFSELPGFHFPANYPTYVERLQLVKYLNEYASMFELHPQFNTLVTSILKEGEGWKVITSEGEYHTDHLVMACGKNNRIRPAEFKGLETFTGRVMQSREYTTASNIKEEKALVVGAGNTGAELALDLSEHGKKTSICIRSPIFIVPKQVFGRSTQVTNITLASLPNSIRDFLSKIMLKIYIGDLSRWGVSTPSKGVLQYMEQTGKVPIMDIGTVAAIKAGKIKVVKGIESIDGDTVHFIDGSKDQFDLIVLATGYQTGIPELLDNADKYLNQHKLPDKAEFGDDQIYFVGFKDMGQGVLYQISKQSVVVADKIAFRNEILLPDVLVVMLGKPCSSLPSVVTNTRLPRLRAANATSMSNWPRLISNGIAMPARLACTCAWSGVGVTVACAAPASNSAASVPDVC